MASISEQGQEGSEADPAVRPAADRPAGHEPDTHSGVVFAGLVETGRFFRDSRLGGMFHPGKVSLREVCRKDSLHVSIGEGNRVSVHVDRYSPLAERMRANRSGYSPVRVVVHNAGVLLDLALGLVRRRRGQQRCELECARVWVDEDGAVEVVAEPCDDEDATTPPSPAPPT